MKIVIAPDKFKGTLSAVQAAESIAEGVRRAAEKTTLISCQTIIKPMADGGEGSLALIVGDEGFMYPASTFDALMRPVETFYGTVMIDNTEQAVIESASSIGLYRIARSERNPLRTTSYGLGRVIAHTINDGHRNIAVTVGGSATSDCGVGMLAAMGCKFYNLRHEEITNPTGGDLSEIEIINTDELRDLISDCKFSVLCDVDNPLLGNDGAAAVFSPQKGASPECVEKLEQGAKHFSKIVSQVTGSDFSTTPGAGAAGGIAWALKTFCDAKIVTGAQFIAKAAGLEKALTDADLLITGEGGFDMQSMHGKVAGYTASLAKKNNVPTIVLCGTRSDYIPRETLREAGISVVCALTDFSPEKARSHAAQQLTLLTESIMTQIFQ